MNRAPRPLRNLSGTVSAMVLLACASMAPVHAADDASLERARQMLRRTQEALRQAQSDNADLVRAKVEAEKKAQAAAHDVDMAKNGSKTAERGLHAQLLAAKGLQAEFQQKYTAADALLAEMKEKQRATAQLLANREAELAESRQSLAKSVAANAICEDKNAKLYTYGREMLDRYKNKGVWSSLAQKEPVLGLKEVAIENVVQEYSLKMAGQRVTPAAP